MKQARLTIYDFHKINDDFDGLHITNFHQRECHDCPPNGVSYSFNWEWHGYSGYGNVNLVNGIVDPNDVFCKESSLTIGSHSKKKANKHYSTIYNESALAILMERIADTFI